MPHSINFLCVGFCTENEAEFEGCLWYTGNTYIEKGNVKIFVLYFWGVTILNWIRTGAARRPTWRAIRPRTLSSYGFLGTLISNIFSLQISLSFQDEWFKCGPVYFTTIFRFGSPKFHVSDLKLGSPSSRITFFKTIISCLFRIASYLVRLL